MSVEAEQLASQGVVGGGPIAGDPDSKQDIWVLGQRYSRYCYLLLSVYQLLFTFWRVPLRG